MANETSRHELTFSMALKFLHSLGFLFRAEGSLVLQMVLVADCLWGDTWAGAADVRRAELEHWVQIKGIVLRFQLVKRNLPY